MGFLLSMEEDPFIFVDDATASSYIVICKRYLVIPICGTFVPYALLY